MYGCHVVPPNDDGADLGVVFFHNEGYSTACGHGTIALVTWALDEGVVDGARARPRRRRRPLGPARDVGHVEAAASGRCVPQRAVVRVGQRLEAAGRVVDVAFGGAFYATLEERSSRGSCRG
jgi:proline racemase